jgi:DNA mismatch repair protein MSH4
MTSTRASTSYASRSTRTSLTSNYNYGSTAQPQTPKTSKSIARPRPRAATSTFGGSGDQQIICAIIESRGISPTIGLAFINLSTTEAVLCQIADSQTYTRTLHKLHMLEPSEIIVSNTATGFSKSKLLQVLEKNLDFVCSITAVPRGYWEEGRGNQCIEQLAFKDDVEAIKVSAGGNYFAICCLAAVNNKTCFLLESNH